MFKSMGIVAGVVLIAGLLWMGPAADGQTKGPVAAKTYDVTGVSYQTGDGWTIHGTLYLPKATPPSPLPAAVMVSEPGLRIRTIYDPYLAVPLARRGKIAILTIDPRGSAGSYGKKDFEKFTMKDLDGFQLDIRGAVKFLSTQPKVDASRVAVLGSGIVADNAVKEAADNPSIQGLVLITPSTLSQQSRDYLQFHSEVPVLTLVGGDRKKSLQRLWSEPYYLSENQGSKIFYGVGEGPEMFHRPGGLGENVAKWLEDTLNGLGLQTEISFKSKDGTPLRGTMWMPDNLEANAKLPAVIMAHGRNHSEESWLTLPREVVAKGMPVLVFDLRGVRKSFGPNMGEVGVNQTSEENDKAYQDIQAAVNFMASQAHVDSARIGLVSATAVNNHAVRAAIGDARIKTIVAFSFYPPDPDVLQYLATNDVPLLSFASTEDANPDGTSLAEGSKLAVRRSKSKESELILYDDAGRGHGILRSKPETIGMTVRWLAEKLAVKPAAN